VVRRSAGAQVHTVLTGGGAMRPERRVWRESSGAESDAGAGASVKCLPGSGAAGPEEQEAVQVQERRR